MNSCLQGFHPVISSWFNNTFACPTPCQQQGWPEIAGGKNVLLLAPTGSGKTLAAFLKCLDWLYKQNESGEPLRQGVQILYVSPLKALNNDIHKNLQIPLQGLQETARDMGIALPEIKAGLRTGDTPASERQKMIRKPPHILITTPESLFLMLSSKARQILHTVRFVIIDEIHTLFPEKRGAHLAVSLARLQHIVGERRIQRIGLSATMRPLDEISRFLVGQAADDEVSIVDSGGRKDYDLQIVLPVEDMAILPEKTIWPAVYRTLHKLIKEHRTTLVFVNNRRLAQRITANLNQLAGKEIAHTHHGSISREMRLKSEQLLKDGEIPCIVATASLELGIDVGHIDLVVQVESPKDVSRGIQRVGRAGHVIDLPSKGRLIPKNHSDLLEISVLMSQMLLANVEEAKAPRNCLDILAQQMVAMTTEQDWEPRQMYEVIRTAYNFTTLSWEDFSNVLNMLAGVYETTEYIDLKPRLYFDRTTNTISCDPYGKRLVYSCGGTIPNRGYFGVYLANSGVRIGELDEEFVYERRLNERFSLGTAVWRIEEIRQDRVIVTPANNQEANVPFWKGETVPRSFSFGKQLGAFFRQIEDKLDQANLGGELPWLDGKLAKNIQRFLQSQKRANGELPTDRRIVVEEFLDEIGEWHLLLHSPFGARVNTLLALLIQDQISHRDGIRIEAVPSDNGVLFHAPAGVKPPVIAWEQLLEDNLSEKLGELISATSLFGITFRHCAQRSLVLSLLAYDKKRTPLWLSRLKAGDLLQIVAKHKDFPLIKETYREIFQEYFNLEDLREVLTGILHGDIETHQVRNELPSPFAREHLFTFVPHFMYQDDTPKGTSKGLFGLERGAFADIVGCPQYQSPIKPEVVAYLEEQLQGRDLLVTPSIAKVQYWLERVGDICRSEISTWFPESQDEITSLLERLLSAEKAVEIPWGENSLVVSTLRHELYQKIRSPETRNQAVSVLLRHYCRIHGPFSAQQFAVRYLVPVTLVEEELAHLEEEGLVKRGDFLPGKPWCAVSHIRRLHQQSLAKQRRGFTISDSKDFAVFLSIWQGLGQQKADLAGVSEAIKQLSAGWLNVSDLETSLLPARFRDYQPHLLDQVLASGLFRFRAKQVGSQLRVRFEQAYLEALDENYPAWLGERRVSEQFSNKKLSLAAKDVLNVLHDRGAMGLVDIGKVLGCSLTRIWPAVEELLLAGLLSNDCLGPLRLISTTKLKQRKDPRLLTQPTVLMRMGRFFPLSPNFESSDYQQAETLLTRYGIVSREMAVAEGIVWGDLYPVLDYWENIGKVRRGYLVEGLSGVQFALPQAINLLQKLSKQPPANTWVIAKDDPANPGQLLSCGWRLGSVSVFSKEGPLLTAHKRRIRLESFSPLVDVDLKECLIKLVQALYPYYPDEKIVISEYDGNPVLNSPIAPILKQIGFEQGYKEMILWPTNRVRALSANQR